jgi:hypothetical protein
MPTQTLTEDSLNTKLLLKALVAFKNGNFSVRLPGEWTGEAGKIADTFNDIIELSDQTTKEVERVSRGVGREGKITNRASVPSATGSWLRLIESTNFLIDDMARPTSETRVGKLLSLSARDCGRRRSSSRYSEWQQ